MSPIKGKYDQAIDTESAYEELQRRLRETGSTSPSAPGQPTEGGVAEASAGGGIMAQITAILASIFGTDRPRSRRLSTGQVIARQVTRTVSNQVAGQVAADIGKAIGGKTGSSIGRGDRPRKRSAVFLRR